MTESNVDGTRPDATPFRKRRLLVAVAAVSLLLVVAVLLAVFLRDGDHTVRYEVDSQKNSVTVIMWGDTSGLHILRRDNPQSGSVDSPWSEARELEKTTGRLVLTVTGTAGAEDMVTCRILVDGKVEAESSTPIGAQCMVDIEKALAGHKG